MGDTWEPTKVAAETVACKAADPLGIGSNWPITIPSPTARTPPRDLSALLREADKEARKRDDRYVEIGKDVMVWQMPTLNSGSEPVKRMLGRIHQRKALVLDLRGNPGGAETTLLTMIGGFFAEDTPVAMLRSRTDSSFLVATGSGDDRVAGPLLVLVDGESASAAEIIARTVQLTKRGTVIGDRTLGAVMRSRGYSHNLGVETLIPFATSITVSNAVMPDGASLEGLGVVPDEVVLPTAQDLAAGRDPVARPRRGIPRCQVGTMTLRPPSPVRAPSVTLTAPAGPLSRARPVPRSEQSGEVRLPTSTFWQRSEALAISGTSMESIGPR